MSLRHPGPTRQCAPSYGNHFPMTFACLASDSSTSNSVSLDAYFLNHHAKLAFTISRFRFLPSWKNHVSNGSPVTVPAFSFDFDHFPECQCGDKLLGSVAEGLPFFRGVNAVEPGFLSSAIVHDADGVPIRDANDKSGEIICTNLDAWE